VKKIFRHSTKLFLTAGIIFVFAVKAWADIIIPPEIIIVEAMPLILFCSLVLFIVVMVCKNVIRRFYKKKNVSVRQQYSIYSWLRLFIVCWVLCLIIFVCLLLILISW
jgi:hypothetical protein